MFSSSPSHTFGSLLRDLVSEVQQAVSAALVQTYILHQREQVSPGSVLVSHLMTAHISWLGTVPLCPAGPQDSGGAW